MELASEEQHPGSESPRRGTVARRAALAVGIVTGAVMLALTFFGLAFNACVGAGIYPPSEAWICTDGRDLLPWIEAALFIVGPGAPVLGGALTSMDGRWRWLAIGLAVAGVCVAIVRAIVAVQWPMLS